MGIQLKPKKVIKFLVIIALCLFAVHIAMKFFYFIGGHDHVFGLAKMFDVDQERNIPTLFSTLLLFLSSILLATIGFAKRKRKDIFNFHWLGLSLIFLFLTVDEWAMIHEELIEPVRLALNASGYFYFAWVIPYGILIIILFFIYFKFLIHLNAKTRRLFIISGGIYLSGALGFEMLGARHIELYSLKTGMYAIITTIEEFLEVIGLLVFNYALMEYISSEFQNIKGNTRDRSQ